MNPPPKFSRRDYLEHIAEAAGLILEYTRGLSKDGFMNDRKTQQAVLMNLMTIGEAAVLRVTPQVERNLAPVREDQYVVSIRSPVPRALP